MKRAFAILLAAVLLLASVSLASAEEEKKVLHWYIDGEVTTMDSGKTYDVLSSEAVSYFVDTLYRFDENGEAQPNLAVDEPVFSEDGSVVTITLRDDARFADGTPITAQDIEYAVRRVYDPAVASQSTISVAIKNADAVRAGEKPVEELGVRAVSDQVIEFTLDAADPYITKKLTDVAYAPVSQAFAEAWGEGYALTADAILASGAFSLADWNGTDITWRYVKNPYYWDAENVYFDEITIQVVKDENTKLNLYEAGQLDGTTIASDFVVLYEGQPDLVKVQSLRMTNLELGISSNAALQNENIRKALLYGIDREELCSAVLNGAAVPAVGVVPNGIAVNPETQVSIAEDWGRNVYFDLDLAQQYFAQGLEELGVDSVALRLVTSDTDESIKVGTYLQSALQTNLPGLTINLANVPASVRFEEMMSYNFDLALGGWTGDYDPTSYVNQWRGTAESKYAHNHAQWESDELEGIINALYNLDGNDFVTRWNHLRQANQYLIDNAVVIPLEQEVKGFLVNPKLKGYITHQLGQSTFDLTRAYFED